MAPQQQGLAKDFEFELTTEFGGYNSARDKTNIAENLLVQGSKNVYKTLAGTIAVRQGQKRTLGPANTTQSACSSNFVWSTSWGATYPLVVSNSNLYVVFEDIWYSLESSLTATRYVFDKWWDNTEKKDRVLFVNGSDNMQHWSGGITYAAAQGAGGSTLTKQGTPSWQQAGFANNTAGEKKFKINGSATEYTYTGGESTTTLTGITPALPAITAGDVIIQSVITEANTPAADFDADFIKVINNQVYVGSYTSRITYVSDNEDFTDYVVPTPRIPGSPELITLDASGKGIGVRQGKAYIGFGNSGWAVVSFQDVTVGSTLTQQTSVDITPVVNLGGPYAHEFIDTVGDSLVYLAQDQQVRTYGDFTNLFNSSFPSLSQEINTELKAQDFTGGTLQCIGDFTYITCPNTGKVYLYQVRQSLDANNGTFVERIWHPPFIWNLVMVDQVDGVVIGFSSANPQIYELWDTDQWYDESPDDEQLPYECIAAFGYTSKGRRQGLMAFDKTFTEGYISEGTTLTLRLNYNYQGSLAVLEVPVNSLDRPAYIFQGSDASSLGDSSIGEEILGDGLVDPNTGDSALPKFKVINSMPLQNCFEYQMVYYSDAANAQWELLAYGTNVKIKPEEQANYIINKLRN